MRAPSVQHDVHGLVVGVVEYGERDRLITLLTAEKGLITARVNGARQLKNRYMATTQIFCYGTYMLVERSGRFTVQDVELEETFYGLRADITRASLASYICEVVCYTGTEQPDTELLRLVLNTLFVLANDKYSCQRIKAVFEFRMAALLGFMPDVDGCAVCGEDKGEYVLHIPQGNLICSACRETLAASREMEGYEGRDSIALVSPGVLDAIRYIVHTSPERIFSFRLEEDDEHLLSLASEGYLLWHIDRTFSSLTFYKQVAD